MKTIDDVIFFEKNGYLLLKNMFTPDEVELLKKEMLNVSHLPGVVYEGTKSIIRSINGAHKESNIYANVCRHSSLLAIVKEILQSDVYVHQFKINTKPPFDGDVWQWHQDHLFWLKEDGMLKPEALTAAIFLTEANDFNAPMMLVPGSHLTGTIDAPSSKEGWESTLSAELKYTLSNCTIAEQIEKNGMFLAKGAPGDVLLFHCNTLHASNKNLSPYERVMLMISYNSIENKLTNIPNPRPDFLASREYCLLEPLRGSLNQPTEESC